MPTERFTPLDASFLYLERPAMHMHVAGLSVLDPSTRPGGSVRFGDLASLFPAPPPLPPPPLFPVWGGPGDAHAGGRPLGAGPPAPPRRERALRGRGEPVRRSAAPRA